MIKRVDTFLLIVLFLASTAFSADVLSRTYDLAGKRSVEKQYFVQETQVFKIAANGELSNRDVFRLFLVADPTQNQERPVYTCLKLAIQFGDHSVKTVPVLDGWSYQLSMTESGMDEKGRVFGIPHDLFENLVDSDSARIVQEQTYMIYNTFIDFHGFCDIFARPIEGGKGVQDLSRIGDKIVHSAAFTEPPVNLGSSIKEGSTFKNGEVTLQFKGLSLVNGKECALLAYDSGASSFHMIVEPMPSMLVDTRGSSHYFGDIYLDLNSYWAQQVTMTEFVVSESNVTTMNTKINGIFERQTTIRNLDAAAFESELASVQ